MQSRTAVICAETPVAGRRAASPPNGTSLTLRIDKVETKWVRPPPKSQITSFSTHLVRCRRAVLSVPCCLARGKGAQFLPIQGLHDHTRAGACRGRRM